MKYSLITFFLLLYSVIPTTAQEFMFMVDETLSSKRISDIYQDHDGFIWVSTDNGLNRFDGNKVFAYNHVEGDTLSLIHDLVYTSYEDDDMHLFVGTYLGMQYLDKRTNRFSSYAVYADGRDFDETVSGFCKLPDGSICSFGDNAYKVTIANGKPVASELDWDIDAHGVFRVACDNQNNIWVLKREDGLYRIRNGKAKKICQIQTPDFYIYDFHIVNGSIYIVSTDNDVYVYNPDNDSVVKFNNEPISKASIRYLIDHRQTSDLIACTDGNGFKIINHATGKVNDVMLNIPMQPSNHLKIHKVIRDQKGNMWVNLYQKGIAAISSSQNAFGYWGSKSLVNNIIGKSPVVALCKDSKGNMWVGTDGDGIYRISDDGASSYHYPTYTDGGNTPSNIRTICADSNGDVWFGSYGNGIGRIAAKNGKYSSCEDIFRRLDVPVTRFYDIVEDGNKRLWAASLGAGIFCYDLTRQKLVEELSFYNEINKWQTSLLYTSDNLLYVGTFDGIFYIDLSADTISPRQMFERVAINSMYEDSKGQVWAGSNNGLLLVDTTGILQTFSVKEGLPQVSINSINEGDDNTLWLASDKGLISYSPSAHSSVRYTTNDGLQSMEFSKHSSLKDASGRIWFAGEYGVTFFRQQDLNLSSQKRHARIIDFLVNNETVSVETLSDGKPIISEPLVNASTFELSSYDNSFILEFGTYELDVPKKAEFCYSVNDGKWNEIPPVRRRAYFNNLAPGTYIIKYKMIDNLVESDVQQVKVVVRPYWWMSGWAIFFYVLLLVIVVTYLIYHVRILYLAKKRNERHKRAIEINEAKLRFFTNISHEIKTPLSLIISPLQKLMSSDDDPKRQDAYRTMYRNSKMLTDLINQLLDVRKIDNGRLHLCFRNADIIVILKDLCSYFNVIAVEKNISFSFVHDASELFVWIDPDYFDKIVMNLLTNAFKYTPNGGNIVLSVKTIEKTDGKKFAEIMVKDNGIGIKEKDLSHIFERFYIAENNKATGSSNGIGLHLTRSIVNLHHGSIRVMNNADGVGACFVVELPIGKEHFRSDDTLLDEETKVKSSSSFNLLIVDDDPEIRNYLRKELSSDFHIDTCSNGKEALQYVFSKQPDIIISDVMMPEMDGITLCKKIKQNIDLNHIPVILLTAKSDENTNLQGLKYGADAYLTKPFYIEIVRRTALNLVNLRLHLHNIYTGQQTQEERQIKIEMESPNKKLLDRIMKVVNNNIGNPDLSIDMICEEVGISRAHIYRKLKELTNQSGRDFIKNVRLKYAENLLLEDRYSIGNIAEKVGFKKQSSFTLAFKEKYGLPPQQWREAQKKKADGEAPQQ